MKRFLTSLTQVFWLTFLSSALLVACAHEAASEKLTPEKHSIAEHEAQAAKAERQAEAHTKFVRAAGPYNIRYKAGHEANAAKASKHAAMHHAQAEAMKKSAMAACAGSAADAPMQCPMVTVERAEDTDDGVLLWLSGDADSAKVAELMNCHIEHARHMGMGDMKGMDGMKDMGDMKGMDGMKCMDDMTCMEGCPFMVPGVSAAPVQGMKAVKLSVKDPSAVQMLQMRMHQMQE